VVAEVTTVVSAVANEAILSTARRGRSRLEVACHSPQTIFGDVAHEFTALA
jgi:hypothetical protein